MATTAQQAARREKRRLYMRAWREEREKLRKREAVRQREEARREEIAQVFAMQVLDGRRAIRANKARRGPLPGA